MGGRGGCFSLGVRVDLDQARVLLEETGYEVRAFLGYAGWGRGQLEEELAHDSWVISAVENQGWLDGDEQNLWRNILGRISPAMKIQAEAPEDPSLN